VTAKTAAPRAGAERARFDPARHERELVAILDEVASAPVRDLRALDRILKKHPRNGCGLFSRSELIAGVRHFAAQCNWPVNEAELLDALRLRPVRTHSGVTPVTVLTKPFPCPGRCLFCPSDVRMPKSYLPDEPGAQRAEANGFDPYRQTWSRLDTLRRVGHPVHKVELIVLGGTWSHYPEPYQIWFVERCLRALCDFAKAVDGREAPARVRDEDCPEPVDGRTAGRSYNQVIRPLLAARHGNTLLAANECANWEELEQVQRENESAGCRCVGLSIETRPDCVTPDEVRRIRRLGATKVQIGIQSLSDRVLEANRRGHDVSDSRRAMRWLRAAGLKIQVHWMPNLYGSSPADDVADFARLFDDADFRPDELKLYPCSLIASADLMAVYASGDWRPYSEAELLEVVEACLAQTPPYCRVTRVIRDFSSGDIVDGNRTANLREVAERRLRARGLRCRDIRAREIRGRSCQDRELSLGVLEYATSVGREVFLQFTTRDDRIAAFLRLCLPDSPSFLDEVRESALIREVHVYGPSLPVGERATGRPQHQGLGRALMQRAAQIAGEAGFDTLSVISAVGTRAYYRDLGFADGSLYQHRRELASPS